MDSLAGREAEVERVEWEKRPNIDLYGHVRASLTSNLSLTYTTLTTAKNASYPDSIRHNLSMAST